MRLAENFRALFYAPLYAAHSLGFDAQEGVEVELIGSSAPGDGVSALLNDTIDITWGGPMRVMKAHDLQRSSPLVWFLKSSRATRSFWWSGHDRTDFQLQELASLHLQWLEEPTPWMCLQNDLREQGMDPLPGRQPDQSHGRQPRSVVQGATYVVQLFEPYASMALQFWRQNSLCG